jgi:hypothetical protein
MAASKISRRKVLETTALGVAAGIAAPYVRGAFAAGKLSVGFWDHWVPGANDTLTKACQEWAAKEKVELQIDYITSQGFKNILTIAAEAQAKSGHDILAHPTWWPGDYAEQLEPVDDIVNKLIAEYGKPSQVVEYLGKQKGHWVAVPATTGSQVKPPCARISMFKQHVGWDPVEAYPAGQEAKKELADKWTWDTFLTAAEKCAKAGAPFGMPMGQTSDAVDWVGAVFVSHGAQLVDAKGNITVKSDATKQVMEWFKKLMVHMPADVFAWDDASNNKWLVSGKGALIMNPPSAWSVAVRDAPDIAKDCWTFATPAGPKGRFAPGLPYFWGIWGFSPNKPAAKSLLAHISQASVVEQLVAASKGYDLPAFEKLLDFKTWYEEGPPKGTVYHYPPRGDQIVTIAAAPAPPKIAVQIYNQATMTKMVARMVQQGDSVDKAIAWAADELEGFMRT